MGAVRNPQLPAILRAELDEAAAFADRDQRHPCEGRPWALFGSAVMLIHGLRDRIADVDVFVSPGVFEILAGRIAWSVRLSRARAQEGQYAFLTRRAGGLDVSAYYYGWSPGVDAAACRAAAERVHDWWCTPLEIVRHHKAASLQRVVELYGGVPDRHEKHRRDLEALDAYLNRELVA